MTEAFDDDALAESRAVNDRLGAELLDAPPPSEAGIAEVRRLRHEGGAGFPPPTRLASAEDRTIAGPGGPLRLRVLRPVDTQPSGAYLFFHGGGWYNGAADQHDEALQAIAEQAAVTVVSADYRLAPEHPYPAAVDDAEAAACWLVEHGRDELGTDRLVIAGESSGAHLAASALLRLRDRHGAASAFAGANLTMGIYDLGLTPSVRAWGARNLILSRPIIDFFVETFTPGLDGENRRDPDISPLYADLSSLAPARFTVGAEDPLIDDSMFMAARWRAGGNPTELGVYPASIHGFTNFATVIGATALDAQYEFVRRAVAGDLNSTG